MEFLGVIICVQLVTNIVIIFLQHKTIDNLTKKLMAKNYTEFAAFEETDIPEKEKKTTVRF